MLSDGNKLNLLIWDGEYMIAWQGCRRSKQYFDKEKDWEYRNLDYASL